MSQPVAAFLLAVAAALATMIGWLVTASRRNWPPHVVGIVLVLAAAAMILISGIELLPGAWEAGLPVPGLVLAFLVGALFVLAVQRLAERLAPHGSALGRSATVAAVALAVHNIPEGAATVTAGLWSLGTGLTTAVAVGLHNIPEGIAVAAPVLASGGSRRRALWNTVIATLGEVLGAVVALYAAEAVSGDRAAALLAAVAGVMITLSTAELLPAGVALVRGRSDPGEQH